MAKKRLGDICDVVTGSTPKTNIDEYWDGDIKWITPAELTEDTYILEDSVRKITELAVQKTGLSPFPKGTVILSSRAPIGKVVIAGCEMYCNQGFKNLICTDEIYNEYLYWFLKGKKEFLNSLGRGATFKEISKTIVENIEIELPSIAVQKEIAQKLQKCNEIIRLRKCELQELDNLIKSRFVEMFGDPNIEFKFPTGKFKEYASNMTKGPFGSDMKKDLYVPKGEDTYKVYIQINAIQKNQNLGDYYISKEYFDQKISRFEVHPGDYIITCDGTLGKLIKLDENMERGVISPSLLRLKIDENMMTDKYFEYIWEMYMLPLMKKEARNACLVHLPSAKVIGEVEIPVPPIDLQNEFLDFVTQVDKLKFEVQKSLDETQTLMDSLMQQYFG